MKKRNSWIKLFLFWTIGLSLSVVFSLILVEIVVRIFYSQYAIPVVQALYKIHPNPEIRYTLKPNFKTVAFGQPLSTNQFGFRGPEWKIEKESGVFRIGLIGDSHTFGWGLREEESIGALLGDKISKKLKRKVEVLNFGVPGYNSVQENAVYKTIAAKFKPDLVFVVVCGNDHEPALKVDEDGWLHWRDKDISDNTRVVDPISMNLNLTNTWIYKNSSFMRLISTVVTRIKLPKIHLEGEDRYDANWMEPVTIAKVSEGLRVPVYEPLKSLFDDAKIQGSKAVLINFDADIFERQTLKYLAQEEKVPNIEIFKAFKDVGNFQMYVKKHSLGWDSHGNAEAWQIMAKYIFEDSELQMILQSFNNLP